MYPFGKSFSYHFIPLIDDNEVTLPTSTDPVSIYIYNNKPTISEARVGTGALSQISPNTWVETDTTSRTIAIPVIEDPTPNNETTTENYWIAINFHLETGGEYQTVVRRLLLERPASHSKRVAVVEADLTDIFPTITKYSTSGQITNYIETAVILIKSFLKSKGYKWASIYRPDEIKLAVIYKALALFAHSQKGEEFKERFVEWNREHLSLIESLKIQLDEDVDGEAEIVKPVGTGWIVSR